MSKEVVPATGPTSAARDPGPAGASALTTGDVPRHILRLALPSAGEVALFGILPLIHAYWMGQLGGMALAAVAMGTALYSVLTSIMRGFSRGGMAIVARHIGANDQRGADHATMQTTALLFIGSIPTALIGLLAGPRLLVWLGAQGELLQATQEYVTIIFWGLYFMEMVPCLDNVIRAAGHPKYTLLANAVNVVVMAVLEPLLVFGVGPIAPLGIKGAAWAAVIGSAAGTAALGWVLWSGRAGLHLDLSDLRPDPPTLWRVVRIGSPVAAQRLSPSLASALMMALVSSLGNDVLTAFSIVSQLSWFLQCPITGIGLATATMVGQNLGAQRPARAERSTAVGIAGAVVVTAVLFGYLALWPAWGIGLFSSSAAVLAIAAIAVRFGFFTRIAMALANVVGAALSGAGDNVSPMVLHMGSLWLVQLPLSWALSRWLGMGAEGIWLGMMFGQIAAAVGLYLRFRQGRWQQITV